MRSGKVKYADMRTISINASIPYDTAKNISLTPQVLHFDLLPIKLPFSSGSLCQSSRNHTFVSDTWDDMRGVLSGIPDETVCSIFGQVYGVIVPEIFL